jgi:predicted phosphodiesterase
MPKKDEVKRNIVIKYCEKYPELSTRQLSAVIFEAYPERFASYDAVRDRVRNIRGQAKPDRIVKERPDLYQKTTVQEAVTKYNLSPKSKPIEDFVFPHKKALVLSDIHLPFHDMEALMLAIDYGKQMSVDSVYLNGDVLDFYDISRFLKEKINVSAADEREYFYAFITMLKNELNVPIFYKLGNHEERWEHYIMRNAPAFADFEDFSFKSVFKLDELGVQYISSRQKVYMGKLIVIHGHEAGDSFFSPVNPARGAFLKYKTSTLSGHNHQTSSHFESNLHGENIGCYSTGCLCALNPDYRPFAYTKWNHGFAIVEVEDDGNYNVDNYRIKNGKVYL